nr:exodeoxyribonuclease VII small subunit [Mariprofundus sp. NF]
MTKPQCLLESATPFREKERPVVSSKKETDELSFEQALEQMTSLVAKLESGELPLEESVAAFEQGVKLSRRCESLLDKAEQRLQVLNSSEDNA